MVAVVGVGSGRIGVVQCGLHPSLEGRGPGGGY